MKHNYALLLTLVVARAFAEVERVPIPGQDWQLVFDAPVLTEKQDQRGSDNYAFKANSGRFNLSFFVEPPQSQDGGHKECYGFYWPQASRNPMLNKKSVKVTHCETYTRVEYMIIGENEGHKFAQRNVNYYLVFAGKWLDVHISIISPTVDDDEVIARFDSGLRCERGERMFGTPSTTVSCRVPLKDRGELQIEAPKGWKMAVRPIGDKGCNAMFSPVDDRNAAVALTVFFLPKPKKASIEALTKGLRAAIQKPEYGYVEKEATIIELTLESGKCVYGTFTDSKLVGKPPVRGDYKFVTHGLMQLRDDMMANVSVFSDDKNSAGHRDWLSAFQTIRVTPSEVRFEQGAPPETHSPSAQGVDSRGRSPK
jgi:hypothetical protein